MSVSKLSDVVIAVAVSGYEKVKANLVDLEKETKKLNKKVTIDAKGKGAGGGSAPKGGGGMPSIPGGGGGGMAEMLGGGGAEAMAGMAAAAAVAAVVVAAIAAALAGAYVIVQQINGLLKVADPYRYELVEAQFERIQVILGRQFVPLLQVAEEVSKKIADAFGVFYEGGGLLDFVKNIAVHFSNITDRILPIFKSLLAGIDKYFSKLAPMVEDLSATFFDLFDSFNIAKDGEGILDSILDILTSVATVVMKVVKVIMPIYMAQLKAWLWILNQVYGVFAFIYGLVAKLATAIEAAFSGMGEVLRTAVNFVIEILNKAIDSINGAIDKLPARLTRNLGMTKMSHIALIEKGKDGAQDIKDKNKAKKDKLDNKPKNKVKIESFALEEGFKKAQAAAGGMDPAKIAENERRKQADKTNSLLEKVADNTVPKDAALGA